uniref:Uncharacterized protein n=1 Tax=Ciona savignyi TaxID=51511 RepID=H2Y9Z9_CIOSA
ESNIAWRCATLKFSQKLSITVYTASCCASLHVPLDTEHVPLADCSGIRLVWKFSHLNIVVGCSRHHQGSIRQKANEFVITVIVVTENAISYPMSVRVKTVDPKNNKNR